MPCYVLGRGYMFFISTIRRSMKSFAQKTRHGLSYVLRRVLVYAMVMAIVAPLLLVLPLRWLNPPTTAFVLRDPAASVNLRAHWVPIDKVAATLPMAVIAAEDQRFFQHYGFDFKALRAALFEQRARRRGGSTITQQLAKNQYLSPSRSLWRKGTEAYLTLWMEALWSKPRILELYINSVEFGPGIYGVGQASEQFFARPAASLSLLQASQLAAVLPNPKRMSAKQPSAYVQTRAAGIRRSIQALGGVGFLPWVSR